MRYLVKRNLLVFFRDKSSVFFSLLGVFIIIGLYVLFLGDVLISSMPDIKGARFLMDSWIMAGLLAVTPVTTVLGALGNMITDKKDKIYKDFAASPIRRSALAGGYILSAFIISMIMTVFTLLLAEGYIIMNGGELLTIKAFVKVIGLIILTVLSSSFMMFFVVTFFNSTSAFATASTVVGSLIGFLTGVYIPIGNLPNSVQAVIKVFPPSHAGVLFRKIMMEQAEKISFKGAPEAALQEFHQVLGVSFTVGDKELSSLSSLIYILITMVLFFILSMVRISRKEK